jgi:hypothetical protein
VFYLQCFIYIYKKGLRRGIVFAEIVIAVDRDSFLKGAENLIMGTECNQHIQRAMALADELLALADAGDEVRQDVGCGVLFGTIRDSAYKIRALAELELVEHSGEESAAKT